MPKRTIRAPESNFRWRDFCPVLASWLEDIQRDLVTRLCQSSSSPVIRSSLLTRVAKFHRRAGVYLERGANGDGSLPANSTYRNHLQTSSRKKTFFSPQLSSVISFQSFLLRMLTQPVAWFTSAPFITSIWLPSAVRLARLSLPSYAKINNTKRSYSQSQ